MTIEAKICVPSSITINRMPPLPKNPRTVIPASIFLTNTGENKITLSAPNPCEMSTWAIYANINHNNIPIAVEPPAEICIQVIQTTEINPGETIRFDDELLCSSILFQENETYKVKYTIYGLDCEDSFTIDVVQ